MSDKSINSFEIIDKIYDVAVDPARLEELVDIWEERIEPLRLQGQMMDEDADITLEHFSRMGLFLDRLQFSDPQNIVDEVSETASLASIVVAANLEVQQVNEAAAELFKLQPGELFCNVFSGTGSQEAINHTIARAIHSPHAAPEFLRFRLEGSERFVVVRVRGLGRNNNNNQHLTHGLKTKFGNLNGKNQRLALVVTTELAWHPSFGVAIKNAFGLTQSEVEIVRALVEGHTIESMAKTRQRSKATIRSQIRSIFGKTETRSQAELVRISLSVMDMVTFTEKRALLPANDMFEKPSLSPTVFHSLNRPKNRRLDHVILGDPNGRPLLYFAGSYGLIRWPASAEAQAKARGIKVIVPLRAGFGHSTGLPDDIDYEAAVIEDYIALLDHHQVKQCPLMSQGGDFCFASLLAAQHPQRISVIIANSPMMPMWKREQYERMDKWYKFILANARFSPKTLPYLVKAGFYLALAIGQHRFMNAIYANNPADLKTYSSDPEVFEAILVGANVVLSKDYTAHEVFAREAIIEAKSDWIEAMESLRGKVPIHVQMGQSSPMVHPQTLLEFKQRYDWVNFHQKNNAGELLFFKYWRETLDFIEPFFDSNYIQNSQSAGDADNFKICL